jgi:hypothetical protein
MREVRRTIDRIDQPASPGTTGLTAALFGYDLVVGKSVAQRGDEVRLDTPIVLGDQVDGGVFARRLMRAAGAFAQNGPRFAGDASDHSDKLAFRGRH